MVVDWSNGWPNSAANLSGNTATNAPGQKEHNVRAGRNLRPSPGFCGPCLEKQRRIDQLQAENQRLRAKLRYQERTAKEEPFGSSTPSSKRLFKRNSLEERQARKGGAKPGHPGHGRRFLSPDEADQVQRIKAADACPDCGARLEARDLRRRTLIDAEPLRIRKKVLELERKQCPVCGRRVEAKPPGVLPRFLFGNALLTQIAVQHYLLGQTLGQIERQTGVSYSSLLQALQALAKRLDPVISRLVEEFRRSPVKHADETGWRTDGRNGYAWLFATPRLSIFRFRGSRAAAVAHEVLGPERLPGVLVVDRYHAYNKAPCQLQYCFAHLLRDLKDLLTEFPDHEEVCAFVDTVAPLLSSAMQVRKLPGSRRQFRLQAVRIKQAIRGAMQKPSRHPAIQNFQRIFRENVDRLYHWADSPTIPAENNLAERDLRPLVIARKISFGSQSLAGAKTRETLMSVLHSLQKQTRDVTGRFQAALDLLVQNPETDLGAILFPADSS